MSVLVIAVATESGVPIFSRRRGSNENIQFSTIASLHGINMFSKCHNLSMVNTQVDNGTILWKEYCKSVTLIGVATGGLECDLELLLSNVHNLMIFSIGKKELENIKNIDQIKRDLRQCYTILDYLLESLDPEAVLSPHPTLVLDHIQSILSPQAQQLQQALDNYAENVTGRWACLSIHGHLVATSSDFSQLDPREARLLLLLAATQDGAPLRDTPVYLPQISPNVAFRAVTCKLLADVYILVVCGATPALSQIDEIVLQCWESFAQVIKDAKITYPRNFPISITFEPCVLGSASCTSVNKCLKYLFTKKDRQIEHLPPTKAALYHNLLRAIYQGVHVWGQLALAQDLPCPSTWGWTKVNHNWGPTWTDLPVAAEAYLEIVRILLINTTTKRCVFSRHLHATNPKGRGMPGAHKVDILRTFYVTTARDLARDSKLRDGDNKDETDELDGMCEVTWVSEYHKCHAQRSGNLLCCALYSSSVPSHTMRLITNQMLQDFSTNKDIHW